MKNTDKFLIGIIVGIVVLIVVAFVLTMVQPEPAYQAEDTPEGVTHNYLLALQNQDYDRAYEYLSPSLPNYPKDLDAFIRDVERYDYQFRTNGGSTLSVQSSDIRGDRATVKVLESRFYGRGLFDSSQEFNNFNMNLKLENGDWKLISSDFYFYWCWGDSTTKCE